MKKFTKLMALVLALVLVAGLLTACGPKQPSGSQEPAAEQKPITLPWGFTAPANSVDEAYNQRTADRIKEYTNGAVTIQLYPGGQLGNEKVVLEGIVSGTIEQAGLSPNVVATVIPEFNVLCLPFLFDDVAHFFRVVTSDEYFQKMNEAANAKGMQYIGVNLALPRTVATRTPVRTPADAKGQVIRVMDGTIYSDMMACWGFGSSVIAYGEVYTALQQGVVDGVENADNGNLAMKFYEQVEYSTSTYHVFHGQHVFMNLDVWNSLTPATQEAIRKAWKDVTAETAAEQVPLVPQQAKELADTGINIIELTADEKQQWIDASQPLYEKYRGVIGEEFYDWFIKLVDSHRQ